MPFRFEDRYRPVPPYDDEASRWQRMDEWERRRHRWTDERSAGWPGDYRWTEYDHDGVAGPSYSDHDRPLRERQLPPRGLGGETGRDTSWSGPSSSVYGAPSGTRDGLGSEHRLGPEGPFAGRGPKGYTRSDARINDEVCDRLSDAPDIDASNIEVRVTDGEVTLSGTVDERWQKHLAEDIIENVSGVRDVHNELRLRRFAS